MPILKRVLVCQRKGQKGNWGGHMPTGQLPTRPGLCTASGHGHIDRPFASRELNMSWQTIIRLVRISSNKIDVGLRCRGCLREYSPYSELFFWGYALDTTTFLVRWGRSSHSSDTIGPWPAVLSLVFMERSVRSLRSSGSRQIVSTR